MNSSSKAQIRVEGRELQIRVEGTQTLRRGAVQEPTASSAPKTKPWERNLAASPATAAAAAAVAAASG
jgi:hypothetical protein